MSAIDYYEGYRIRKQHCGRKKIKLPEEERSYVIEKVNDGWTPDTIKGRNDQVVSCSMKTLYRMFKENILPLSSLPMKGRRKPNGHHEKRGKQPFHRNISERTIEFPDYHNEFGHLEGDTIVGCHHASAVITLVERVSRFIITIRPAGRKAVDIEEALSAMLSAVPAHLFKSVTFDCGKEFSNWKAISNQHDLSIFFADPGCPSQRGLNEHSNGMLRRNGLPKQMDFNLVTDDFIISVTQGINNRPRKSLGYHTPMEVFMSFIEDDHLSSLI